MIAVLPLCLEPTRFRTWAVMLASGLLGRLVSTIYTDPVLAFVVIDVATAFVVLARRKGTAQHYIGRVYVGMIIAHIGYVIASNPLAITVYYQLLTGAGWLAWFILLCWGAGDAGKRIGARLGLHWPLFHRSSAVGK
ncbi:hypothetical protein [Sphingopyxis sp. JAI128]|uniref:hypothetical protein n=1 Tax=Sphingopyxis sp. JAI128 TaxID=2723066 RepID=UPI001615C9E4|nr:hypothetical protein [Sphingopyxis sp. JAI128]MBB6424931.1 hypothetical protein [Sphingopyxis sp. JAI128]